MKYTLLIALLFVLNTQNANDSLVVICKNGKNIRLYYADSWKGIKSIKSETKMDTLSIFIKVSHSSRADPFEIPLPSNIRFIRYGKVIKEAQKLPICHDSKVNLGNQAVEDKKNKH